MCRTLRAQRAGVGAYRDAGCWERSRGPEPVCGLWGRRRVRNGWLLRLESARLGDLPTPPPPLPGALRGPAPLSLLPGLLAAQRPPLCFPSSSPSDFHSPLPLLEPSRLPITALPHSPRPGRGALDTVEPSPAPAALSLCPPHQGRTDPRVRFSGKGPLRPGGGGGGLGLLPSPAHTAACELVL